MGTATILGDTYNTVVMPDGKEWSKELRYASLGRLYTGDPDAGASFGRLYNHQECDAFSGLIGDGWRVPTDEDYATMFQACGAVLSGGEYWSLAVAPPPTFAQVMKTTGTGMWNADPFNPNTDVYGFSGVGSGLRAGGSDYDRKNTQRLLTSTVVAGSRVSLYLYNSEGHIQRRTHTNADGGDRYGSVRLVRDVATGPRLHVSHAGVWKPAKELWVPHNGVWKKSTALHAPSAGTWKKS